jgi:hypothetical protein
VDFGPGFYTTTNRQQALDWAQRLGGDTGEVVVFKVPTSALSNENLSVLGFEGVTPQWENFVKAGRRGEFTVKPWIGQAYNKLQNWYDVVEGPMYLNPQTPKESARGGGQQSAWISERSARFLSQYVQQNSAR